MSGDLHVTLNFLAGHIGFWSAAYLRSPRGDRDRFADGARWAASAALCDALRGRSVKLRKQAGRRISEVLHRNLQWRKAS